MPSLKRIIEETDTVPGRVFDLFIQFLIVFSLVTFSIETLPDLSERQRWLLQASETFMIACFTVEYLLRLYVASSKRGFVFSFFGLVDLAAILPFYLAAGLDLRALRALRLLRLVRILKLARYSEATKRFSRAFVIAKEELVLFLSTAMILLYLAGVGIYYFEHEAQPEVFSSVIHSLWWAVATMTTVGYGDVYPVTGGGKCFTAFVLLIGLGIVSVPAGLIASALSKARAEDDQEKSA